MENLGAGITLVPYSDVGYSILGISTNVEGSNESFKSSINGLGGLNNIRFNLGYALVNKLRLGLSASFLFGSIEENEAFIYNAASFESTEKTNYSGVRLGFGLQWDVTENITLGSTIQLPTSLNGNLKRSVNKSLYGTGITVEDETADSVSDFKLPLEMGFGLSIKPIEELNAKVFLKVSEAAFLLGCSPKTIYRLIDKGIIQGVNLGERMTRVSRESLNRVLTPESKAVEKEIEYALSDCYTLAQVKLILCIYPNFLT